MQSDFRLKQECQTSDKSKQKLSDIENRIMFVHVQKCVHIQIMAK